VSSRPRSIPYADLERIPEVIAVAGGEAETEALRAALPGRAVTSVVTDSAVAAKLLAQELPTDRQRR
jgi:DNA-binding transcriptional regulator LsrR (DeoR family)